MSSETQTISKFSSRPARSSQPSAATSEDLALFHRTLSEMCRARVPLPKALRLLSHDLSRKPLAQATKAMALDVEQGLSLSEAYAAQSRQLPSLYQALIEAGIRSGDLPSVLDEFSRHADERAQVASRLRRALFYPLVSAISVVAVGAVLFGVLGGDLPSLVAKSSWGPVSPWFSRAPLIAIAVLAVAVLSGLLFVWFRNPLDGGPRVFKYGIPVFGRLHRLSANASFASTMAMLLKRAMPLPSALRLAAASAHDARATTMIEAMVVAAENGENLAGSLRDGGLLSPAMLWFVEAGEAGGSVPRALSDVADIYRKQLARGVDHLCFVVAPLGLIGTGLIVLGFAVSFLGPLWSTYRGLFNF